MGGVIFAMWSVAVEPICLDEWKDFRRVLSFLFLYMKI